MHMLHFSLAEAGKRCLRVKGVLINSPKVATYDLKPEMSAFEVRDAVIEEINKRGLRFYLP